MSELITILGAGESGMGAAMLAARQGYEVFVSDGGAIPANRKEELSQLGVPFEEGKHTLEKILQSKWVVKSPGIPDKASIIEELSWEGIPVISEIEFAWKFIPAKSKVIAITGTNGKTTTTLLTHHLLKEAGLDVALGGNVGISLAKLVAEHDYGYYVVEVSSFQLDGIQEFAPAVAVLLNITPDHLDRYEYDFEKYVASKFRIAENLDESSSFIYCADSVPVQNRMDSMQVAAPKYAVTITGATEWAAKQDGAQLLFKDGKAQHQIEVDDLTLIGKHNMQNTMAAVLAALKVGVPIEAIRAGLKTFRNASHRLERCGEIEGVRFINDSKATNVDAVYYALDGIGTGIVWIAGGIDKGNDYDQLIPVTKEKVKGLICLGTNNGPLLKAFADTIPVIKETADVREAVRIGLEIADKGDTILLSPACASFDLFKNYEDRGEQFMAAVEELKHSKSQT